MCKQVEEVLGEVKEMEPKCEVTMDGNTVASNDFVCVLAKENGDASILYNTDALTLGLAMRMIAVAFTNSMAQLSDEEREMVSSVLGSDFDITREEEEAAN